MNAHNSTSHLQSLLDSFRAGHDSALEPLLQYSMDRCRVLAHRMFRHHRDLHALDETDDVLQQAMVRLHRAICQVRPDTVRAFFGLAARQIRWVLCDLARDYAKTRCVRYSPESEPHYKGGEPSDLLEWTEFHEKVDTLPDEEREVFDVLFYQNVSQADAAALLGISVRSVKRRWQKARLLLRDAWPSLE